MKRLSVDRDSIIEFLREHKPYLEKEFGITKIALFGSYARGDAGKQSDIDILIDMKVDDYFKRFYLKEFLQKHFNKKVDIGYFKSIRKYIKDEIEKDIIYA